MSRRPDPWRFLSAFQDSWFTAMSGGLSVPLAIAGILVDNPAVRICLFLTAALCFIVASYRVWAVERVGRIIAEDRLSAAMADERILELYFDENGPQYVLDKPGLHGLISRRWFVSVRNASAKKSVDDVIVRAIDSPFVLVTIRESHMRLPDDPRAKLSNTVMAIFKSLPPSAVEFVELFGIGGWDTWSELDILNKRTTFLIEAMGRDASVCRLELEWDPSTKPPTIRRHTRA